MPKQSGNVAAVGKGNAGFLASLAAVDAAWSILYKRLYEYVYHNVMYNFCSILISIRQLGVKIKGLKNELGL